MLHALTNSSVRSHARIIFFILTILQYNSSAYNIDSRGAKIFSDPARVLGTHSSYFGFSVALYAGEESSMLLVGAPRANSNELKNVKEPGVVYACKMDGVCKEWVIDKSGNGLHKFVNQIKDGAWIGATIAVQNETEARVVVCGPRWTRSYKYYISHRHKLIERNDWYVNGICYGTSVANVTAFEREADEYFLPFWNNDDQITMKNKIGFYNYGMSQLGFSLHMNSLKYGTSVILGSPGVYNWKGDTILATAAAHDQLFLNTVVPSVAKEESIHSYNYFGYAVTAGAYFNSQNIWYASSAPRSENMYGKVIVFTFPNERNQPLFIKTTLRGQQYGEYFGGALASCDVNNDRRHELIVGAPQSKDMDEGRVYIFTAQNNNDFKILQTIEGEIIDGRFGSTVACLGDIDYDGHNDIAVAAPYEEGNGGAVYIFNGNRDGVSRKYSQRLVGSEFSSTIRGFGISISEPRDIDYDDCPDFAVGAYLSDEVVLLRSVPVVTINVTLTHLKKIKLLRNTTSFVIEMYASYDGAYVPDSLRILTILEIDQLHRRATYRKQKGVDRPSDTLHRAAVSYSPLEIHLIKDIQNVIDPLEISVSIRVVDDLYAKNNGSSKQQPCASCVVVNRLMSKTEDVLKLPFAVECGEDNICMSDLNVTLSTDSNSSNRYVIGATSTITLRIDVHNRGEPAYQARVRVSTQVLSLASVPPECTENSRMSSMHDVDVTCDIGNPLRTNKTLILQLDMSTVAYDVKEVEIRVNASTQSEEMTPNDNSHTMTVYFDVDMDIAIAGKTQENLYSYSRENEEKPLNDIRFQHFYEVQKFGASPIDKVVLTVKIPTHWRHTDTEDIMIVSIDSIIGMMDGYQFSCSDSNQTDLAIKAKRTASTTDNAVVFNSSSVADSGMRANLSIEENTLMNVPLENRTLYVNCTNDVIRCTRINCILGPFTSSLSVAKLLITLDLQLASFHAILMKEKDIIFFVSEGSVTITQPHNISQRNGHKPDTALVSTTFLGSPIAQQIAVWIIALSVFLGIILLILLILGLIKIGFFNRKKKLELEALKAETNTTHNVVLETTSSTEVLEHD